MERLERELDKITQVCNQDGSVHDSSVQKLLEANMSILQRIKQLHDTIGTKLGALNQGLNYGSNERDNSIIPAMGRP